MPTHRSPGPDDLLSEVLDAHGGLDAWSRVTGLTVQLSLDGPFWSRRGWPDVSIEQTVRLETRRERITFAPFPGPGHRSVLDVDPERVAIETDDGTVVEERHDPAATFPRDLAGRVATWDAVQLAYFTSTATWGHLTTPFVLTAPGVVAREIEPWQQDGETWRRLAVAFPPTIVAHTQQQVLSYDERFMLRRLDDAPQLTGGSGVAHYTHDFKTFDGFVFPTLRLVHACDERGNADRAVASIVSDVKRVTVHRDPPALTRRR
jgi:hypothetical protein